MTRVLRGWSCSAVQALMGHSEYFPFGALTHKGHWRKWAMEKTPSTQRFSNGAGVEIGLKFNMRWTPHCRISPKRLTMRARNESLVLKRHEFGEAVQSGRLATRWSLLHWTWQVLATESTFFYICDWRALYTFSVETAPKLKAGCFWGSMPNIGLRVDLKEREREG